MVSTVGCRENRPVCHKSPAPAEAQATQQRLLAAAVSRETSARLTIVTDEGDQVTLSSRSAVSAGIGVYDFRDGGQAAHAEAMQFSASREFELSVEGDLSKEELKDIRRVINGVEKVTRKFLAGDLDGAARKAAKLGELGSLVGFDYSFQQREAVAVAGIAQATTAAPAAEGDSSTETPDAVPGPPPADAPPPELDRAAEDVRAAVSDPVFASPRRQGLLRTLLDGLFRHMQQEDGRGWLDALRARLTDQLQADEAASAE